MRTTLENAGELKKKSHLDVVCTTCPRGKKALVRDARGTVPGGKRDGRLHTARAGVDTSDVILELVMMLRGNSRPPTPTNKTA